ncbi:MAG: DUF5995 family protein [Vicinamibacterales bacterium]|nr:DUF5995 family protein [Vicinamibacterales bacterium]
MTIDDIIVRLTAIVRETRRTGSRLGYFAALYRIVTIEVKAGIANGQFEDGARMGRLDVIFARRYLDAWDAWHAGRPTTGSWRVAFRAAGDGAPIILQHLLAGINAHINLDLGIAAATVAPGVELPALQTDFNRINDLLVSLMDEVKAGIVLVSPAIGRLEELAGTADDVLVAFSLTRARAFAWDEAQQLAPLSEWARHPVVVGRDWLTSVVGRAVLNPPPLTAAVVVAIRQRESADVAKVIDVLSRRHPLPA